MKIHKTIHTCSNWYAAFILVLAISLRLQLVPTARPARQPRTSRCFPLTIHSRLCIFSARSSSWINRSATN
jgi:hypothetical protein